MDMIKVIEISIHPEKTERPILINLRNVVKISRANDNNFWIRTVDGKKYRVKSLPEDLLKLLEG